VNGYRQPDRISLNSVFAGQASELSFDNVPERFLVERQVSNDLSQPGAFLLKLSSRFNSGGFRPAYLLRQLK